MKDLEVRTSAVFNFCFLNNTILSCVFFFTFIICPKQFPKNSRFKIFKKRQMPCQEIQRAIPQYRNTNRNKNNKVFLIGDSHLNRINKENFQKEFKGDRVYFRCFLNTNQLEIVYGETVFISQIRIRL